MKSKLPNILTWTRIFLIPVLVIVFVFFPKMEYSRPICGFIFWLAGLTDWLDGTLARRWGQTSNFGAFLDPVADKLLVITSLILILSYDSSLLILFCTLIIIGREVTVSALREWMASQGLRESVKVNWLGKWKTIFQMGALFALLYRDPFFILNLPTYGIGQISIVIAAALALISMIVYLRAGFTALQNNSQT